MIAHETQIPKNRIRFSVILIVTVISLFSYFVLAQTTPDRASRPDLTQLSQNGKLFSIKIVPKEKRLSIFLVGKENARFDFDAAKLDVFMLNSGKRKALHAIREEDHYSVTDDLPQNQPVELEVKTNVKEKTEVFHFKLNQRIP